MKLLKKKPLEISAGVLEQIQILTEQEQNEARKIRMREALITSAIFGVINKEKQNDPCIKTQS